MLATVLQVGIGEVVGVTFVDKFEVHGFRLPLKQIKLCLFEGVNCFPARWLSNRQAVLLGLDNRLGLLHFRDGLEVRILPREIIYPTQAVSIAILERDVISA